MPPLAVDEGFARRIIGVYGQEAGSEWLDHLPAQVEHFVTQWQLTLEPPFPNLSYSWVAPGFSASREPIVLKLAVPSRQLTTEIAALELYDGRGATRLLAADPDAGALLLERLQPGAQLLVVEDDTAATATAISVMRQIWRPLPARHPFPTLSDWAAGLQRHRKRFSGGTGPLPADLFARAEETYRTFLAEPTSTVLLHGDLHHRNILSSTRADWLAIDPEGLAGEPEYEVGPLLRNPYPQLLNEVSPERILGRRLSQLADELRFDRERLRAWGIAHAVLSAVWTIEDHDTGWEYSIEVARHLARA